MSAHANSPRVRDSQRGIREFIDLNFTMAQFMQRLVIQLSHAANAGSLALIRLTIFCG